MILVISSLVSVIKGVLLGGQGVYAIKNAIPGPMVTTVSATVVDTV